MSNSKGAQQAQGKEVQGLPKAIYKPVVDTEGRHALNLVVIGHVDAGKSTLMGNILHTLGEVDDRVMHKNKKMASELGKGSFHYAFLLDEHAQERQRGITMDVAVKTFATPTKRITILDAPGHKDFISNMIMGAVQADVAILVVDGIKGEFERGFESGGQTKEHIMLAKSVGVRYLLVAINKADVWEYSEERYAEVRGMLAPFLGQMGFREEDVFFCPTAGLAGENVEKRSSEELGKWYSGPTLLEIVEGLEPIQRVTNFPLRLSVSDVFKGQTGITVAGKLDSGSAKVGDKVTVMPSGEVYPIKNIERGGEQVKETSVGSNAEIVLHGVPDVNHVQIGHILCGADGPPVKVTNRFLAQILIFGGKRPITKGQTVELHILSASAPATVAKIVGTINGKTGEIKEKEPKCLVKGQTAVVRLVSQKPLCMELFSDFKPFGRVMLREEGTTIAAGVIKEVMPLLVKKPAE